MKGRTKCFDRKIFACAKRSKKTLSCAFFVATDPSYVHNNPSYSPFSVRKKQSFQGIFFFYIFWSRQVQQIGDSQMENDSVHNGQSLRQSHRYYPHARDNLPTSRKTPQRRNIKNAKRMIQSSSSDSLALGKVSIKHFMRTHSKGACLFPEVSPSHNATTLCSHFPLLYLWPNPISVIWDYLSYVAGIWIWIIDVLFYFSFCF